jgi:membrane-bound lytic murein transglycosylase D
MALRNNIVVFSMLALLSACSSVVPKNVAQTHAEPAAQTAQATSAAITQQDAITASEQAALDVPHIDLWLRLGAQLHWQTMQHAKIEEARKRYLRQPNYLPVVSDRASLYLHYIVEEVERRELPLELALLPLVESTLNPFASSSAHAAGLWQIMPATGRHLGLEQGWWYDGRRDLRDSTRVALDYLEALHAEFDQDWLLALAAYNSGKGRVGRAQRSNAKRGLPTDYWSLSLPRETRNYVPKLVALAQIVANPEQYGVTIPAVPNKPAFEIADTGGQLELLRAAELAGIELSTLRAYNPGQLRWATSPNMPPELLLPVGTKELFETGVASLSDADRVQWQRYRIERGDSLIRIASKFDTEVGLLREVNGVRGSRIRAGDILMIPQGSSWESSLALATTGQVETKGYRVRQGDSLYRIAGRFNVSINDIVDWNSLNPRSYLQPGQKLTLYVRGG